MPWRETLYYSFFGPEPDAAVMNTIGFDAFVVGNHEFDDGDAMLATFVRDLETPVVSYNIHPAENSDLNALPNVRNIQKYVIKTLENGEQLGICGITPKQKVEQASFPDDGTTISNERRAARECVADLQNEGINKIVLLTHIGYDKDTQLLAEIEGVDVIIGELLLSY